MTIRSVPRAPVTALAAAAALMLAGCAPAPRLFVNRQADMTLYKKVVMVPFTNLSGEGFAAGRVGRAFTTELVIADRFQIVDQSLLMGELDRAGVTPDATGQYDLDRVRAAAGKLEATAILRGSVTEYGMRRHGTDEFPVVSFDCEMVDVQTGIVIWRISVTQSGKGRLPIVGGAGERTYARVTEEACQRAVSVLQRTIL
jgi:hypothetical protein